MAFDLDRALRRLKPQRLRGGLLRRRSDADLPFAGAPGPGPALLIDSTVYVDVLQGRSPPELDELIQLRACHHSAVCLAELTHAFGRLNPGHGGTARALRAIEGTIADIPRHRLGAPDTEAWGTAGVLTGLLFRQGGHSKGQEKECLNDALIYLQARTLGCAVLTANVRDFDFLNQLLPDGRVLFYRPVRAPFVTPHPPSAARSRRGSSPPAAARRP